MSTHEEEFRSLTATEVAILEKMLEREFRGRDELLRQLPGLQGKKIDSEGSLRLAVASGPVASIPNVIAAEARYPDLDAKDESGYVVLLLHVANGRLARLEILKNDGSKILKAPNPSELEVY